MIVDFHIHPVPSEAHIPESFRDFVEKQKQDFTDLRENYGEPAQLLELMDQAGVDYSVVIAEVAPITSALVTNEEVREFCRLSPRLLPFASINPYMTTDSPAVLERLVCQQGFRGLKMYPTYQYFYPNDPLVYPLYARAQELQIPIMFHTGSSLFKGSRLKYGDPIFFDDVAVDFPKLAIVMCHGGRPFWYHKAAFLARLHENVYVEISGLPPKRLLSYFPELERISTKVLFGSDWYGVKGIKENIEEIRKLPINDDAKELILGANAARLLKLPAGEF
ncbi:MAG: amidohydrolase family protein [Deltaproteobacteria bacterium]|nr:amidohydrolase family protein [Deltaproteobacteria bacterium]